MESAGTVQRAWGEFHRGAFRTAECMLSELPEDVESVRLRLWIALRLGDTEAKLRHGAWLAEHGGAELSAVGRAHENVARAALGMAPSPWIAAPSSWSSSEVAYANGLIAFMQGRKNDVRIELARAAARTAEQRVRRAQLRAWAEALTEDLERQATYLLHALSRAIAEEVDRGLVAIIAGSLALLVREMELGDLALHAEELLEAVEWPEDETIYRFYAQRALAWRKSLRGDWIPAMEALDSTLAIAPDPMRRALVFCDRARISYAVGERVGAASARLNAFAAFDDIDWTKAQHDEAMGVFGAMDVLGVDPHRAKILFDRASSISVSKMTGGAHGCRLQAFKAFALSALTDGEEAIEHAHDAYKLFKSLKYVHRAAHCALRAVELGGGARWRDRVERLIAPYPRSLTARAFERFNSPIRRIRGRRREVVDLLLPGNKTAREIGSILGIAESTVRVHIKQINRLLNVENRSQLVRLFLDPGSAA